MPSRTRLLTVGLLTFLVSAILFFPARVAYQWFAPDELRLSGIRGSVWHGAASEGSLNGVYLRELQWQFRPAALLRASLAYAIESKLAAGFVDANVALGVSGGVAIDALTASVPLGELQSLTRIPGLQGSVSAEFSEIRIADGLPVRADGRLRIARLAIPFVFRDALGDFVAEFQTQDGGIVASLEDVAAVIDLAGSLQVSADGSYRLLGQIGIVANTPAALRQYLSASLGNADNRGQHEFRLEGVL